MIIEQHMRSQGGSALLPYAVINMAAPSRFAPRVAQRAISALDQSHLSSEERIRRAVRAAKLERSPVFTEILRRVPPAVKLANANSLFVMARDALYFQEIRRGHSPEEALKIAAQRLLSLHDR
jgi:hypothetical protein